MSAQVPHELPAASMSAPAALPDQLIALSTRLADKLLLVALRQLFFSNGGDRRMDPAEYARTVARLQRYIDPTLLAAPEQLLAPALVLPRLRTEHRRPLYHPSIPSIRKGRLEVGSEEHLSFATPYVPLDPEYAGEFLAYPEVGRAHLWSWRHHEPAPATILLTHGWGVGAWWMHRWEYDVPQLFHELGLDVYFYLAPYHERRNPGHVRFSGSLHPSADLVRTNEAFIQTAIELRTIISMILDRNPAPLGMMGSSLGGYTSALLASIDERLSFVIPVLPPASMAHLLWDHGAGQGPATSSMRDHAEEVGLTRELFHQFWSLHSPLTHQPKVPWERRMIVTGLGDTLVTAAHTRDLWEHWGRPRHYRFPGGHAFQLEARRYRREMGNFLRDIEVIPG